MSGPSSEVAKSVGSTGESATEATFCRFSQSGGSCVRSGIRTAGQETEIAPRQLTCPTLPGRASRTARQGLLRLDQSISWYINLQSGISSAISSRSRRRFRLQPVLERKRTI